MNSSDEEFLDIWLTDHPRSLQIAFVFLCTSSLSSFFGSFAILYNIIRNEKHKQSLYHRILVGMSGMDMIGSSGLATSVFAVPRDTNLYFAIGNRWTCRASGTLQVIVATLFLYHAELSLYFMLILRFKWTETTITGRLEPFVHIFPLLFQVLFAALLLSFDAIYPDVFFGLCDLGPHPKNCSGSGVKMCENASRKLLVSNIFSLFLFFVVFFGISSTWVAYASVSRTYSRNRRYSFPAGSRNEQMERRKRDMMTQSLLYTIAYTVMLGLIVYTNYGSADGTNNLLTRTIHLCLWYFFLPIQGSVNFFIFFRLRLRSWKEKNSGKSIVWSLWKAVTAGEPISHNSSGQDAPAKVPVESILPIDSTEDCNDQLTDTFRAEEIQGPLEGDFLEDDECQMYPSLE